MSEINHEIILRQVKENTKQGEENAASLARLHSLVDEIRKENGPIIEFFNDMGTAARFGRAIRAIVGWLVVIGGGIAVVWITVAESFHNHG